LNELYTYIRTGTELAHSQLAPASNSNFPSCAMNTEPLDFEKPIFEIQRQLEQLKRESSGQRLEVEPEILEIERKLQKTKAEIYSKLTPAQRVQISRHPQRPFMLDYIQHSFKDFMELHGDRHYGDDAAMPSGFARIGDHKVLVTGHQKGRNTKENLHRNFGSAHPEGYRKALRLFRMAEKFEIPVVTMIDTPGAFPGIGAEERNIAEAIAFNLREMSLLRTPIISVVIGEGGSGGALGIGIADRILMLENSYYSRHQSGRLRRYSLEGSQEGPRSGRSVAHLRCRSKGTRDCRRSHPEPSGAPITIISNPLRGSRKRSFVTWMKSKPSRLISCSTSATTGFGPTAGFRKPSEDYGTALTSAA